MTYDVIIIGGGTAAMSAAIYTARKARKTLVIAKKIGGQTAIAGLVENYPGFKQILGVELSLTIKDQAKFQGAEILEDEAVKGIKKDKNIFEVVTTKNKYLAKSIVIASGKKSRVLNIPGEKELIGKGVAYCAICDAPLFKDKTVVVAGGGNSGLDAAVELLKYAKKIYVFEYMPECIGDKKVLDSLKKDKKVTIITNAQITKVSGDGFMDQLEYVDRTDNKKCTIKAQGLFVEIGWEVVNDFVPTQIKRNKKGEIIVDQKTQMTNLEGVFAAGDVTDGLYKQAIIAAGDAAKAAISVDEFLKKQ